jgi:hypothetical protein
MEQSVKQSSAVKSVFLDLSWFKGRSWFGSERIQNRTEKFQGCAQDCQAHGGLAERDHRCARKESFEGVREISPGVARPDRVEDPVPHESSAF